MEKQLIGKYKLLPCPFCGEYPSVHSGKTECVGHGSYDTQMTIECKCGISLCKSDWDEPNKIWNARIEKESNMEETNKMKNIIWENQWAQFMAKDKDGIWWEFKEKPSLNEEDTIDPWTKAEIKKCFPVGYCDWKQSIIERHPDHEAKAEGKPMKVEGFLTVDGKFFQTEEEAVEHEKLLTIKCMLEGTSLRLHSGDIVKFIEDNKERLRKVFYE